MKRVLFLVLPVFVFVFGTPEQAMAQRFSQNCERAESTSDTMVCVKKQVEAAQKKLNELYKEILQEQPASVVAKLGSTQKNWIAYRNSQCSWESGIAEGGYEKIYELSCIADLTQERIKALRAMNNLVHSDKPREFASHPRWMNVLAADYPDVFWRYGQWAQADIDCNGTEEEIMTGVAINAHIDDALNSDDNASEATANTYRAEAVIALSENVRAGRSKTTVFRMPVDGQAGGDSFCNVPLGLEIATREDDIIGEGEAEEENIDIVATMNGRCPVRVRVLDGVCAPATIYWDGVGYQLQKSIEVVDGETEKNDKQTQ